MLPEIPSAIPCVVASAPPRFFAWLLRSPTQSNGDGLAALAIHKEIGALIAVHLGQHLQDSNREAVDQLWLKVGRGVGCVEGCYPGEHDPLSSFLLPREKTPGAYLLAACSWHQAHS